MTHPFKGHFVSFEGGEGCGKSTQVKLLKEYLIKEDTDAIQTREPGGTPVGEALREILVTGDKDKLSPMTEALLNTAARTEHMRKIIRPALELGNWVLSDRFADSTLVYQGLRGVGTTHLDALNIMAFNGYWPNLTIILDIDAETGVKRSEERKGNFETRFEDMGLTFHKQVRQAFLDIAKANPERCVVIDASASIETVHADIVEAVLTYCNSVAA